MPETLFALANPLALSGWLALAAYPLAPRVVTAVALAIPLLLCTLYAGLILAHWAGAEGGYGSLPAVMRLFDQPAIALAGWVHYLAFDMLVGLWIARASRAHGVAWALVLPCLALTFLWGPAGFLTFVLLAATLRRRVFA